MYNHVEVTLPSAVKLTITSSGLRTCLSLNLFDCLAVYLSQSEGLDLRPLPLLTTTGVPEARVPPSGEESVLKTSTCTCRGHMTFSSRTYHHKVWFENVSFCGNLFDSLQSLCHSLKGLACVLSACRPELVFQQQGCHFQG